MILFRNNSITKIWKLYLCVEAYCVLLDTTSLFNLYVRKNI